MRINGNDHTIEYTEMYYVVTESDDQGAIDMHRDPTYRGNVFRYNYIHDVGPYTVDEIDAHCGRAGIRFDDAISGNLVEANVFVNCSGGLFGAIQIHGGKENLIRNNLFYQCSAGVSFTPWNFEKWMSFTEKYGNLDLFKRNRELYITRYPKLSRLHKDLNENTVVQNIFLECGKTTLRQPEVILFNDNVELHEYPGPVKPEDNHYALESISEDLKKIEFERIPFDKIGLRREYYGKSTQY